MHRQCLVSIHSKTGGQHMPGKYVSAGDTYVTTSVSHISLAETENFRQMFASKMTAVAREYLTIIRHSNTQRGTPVLVCKQVRDYFIKLMCYT